MDSEKARIYCRVRYFIYAILVILVAINIRVGWVLFWPYKPVVINSITILDNDMILHTGEKMWYSVNYEKFMDIPATVNRSLVNNLVFTSPSFMSFVPVGKGSAKNYIEIPSFCDSGYYKLVITYDYEVSGFPRRVVRVRAESGRFEVR